MKIYLISANHPTRKIKTVDASTFTAKKFTWAEHKGKRYLLGATAFYSLAAARRAKIGHLVGISRTEALKTLQPDLYNKAIKLLKKGVVE